MEQIVLRTYSHIHFCNVRLQIVAFLALKSPHTLHSLSYLAQLAEWALTLPGLGVHV